jgi:two-component system nitrogen regulation response regulator GlnG
MDHYMQVAAQELGTPTKQMDARTREILGGYSWPGNVRELANLCRRLTALTPGGEVRLEDLPLELRQALALSPSKYPWVTALEMWGQQQLHAANAPPLLDHAVPLLEKALIGIAMQQTLGNKQGAAKLLGWGRNTLTRKMQELDIYDEYEDS